MKYERRVNQRKRWEVELGLSALKFVGKEIGMKEPRFYFETSYNFSTEVVVMTCLACDGAVRERTHAVQDGKDMYEWLDTHCREYHADRIPKEML